MKYILITGVSTGLGRDAAAYLQEKGFHVIGSVRKAEDAARLEKELGPAFNAVVFDVTDDQAIRSAYSEIRDIVGQHGLYGLVNNAGIAVSGPLKHVPISRWEEQFQINVLGLIRVNQIFLPLLGGEKGTVFGPGRIINISSISGLIANPFMGPYSASKFAVEAVSDVMRREFSIYNIKVVCIEPGVARSEIWDKALGENTEYGQTDYDHLLSKREKIIEGLKARAINASIVSEAIYKGLTLDRPKTRYIVAKKAWLIKLIAYIIPDRWADRTFTRNMKKENIRAV